MLEQYARGSNINFYPCFDFAYYSINAETREENYETRVDACRQKHCLEIPWPLVVYI